MPCVDRATFAARINRCLRRDVGVSYDQVYAALHLDAKGYSAKYQVRRSIVEFNGNRCDLRNLYEKTERSVDYSVFRTRFFRLQKAALLTQQSMIDAGSFSQDRWVVHYGGGRRRTFTYTGTQYPAYQGRVFLGYSSFLDVIGRSGEKLIVWSRMKAGWSLDEALTVPVGAWGGRSGSIYRVTSVCCGRQYVGLTQMEVAQRWSFHLSAAHSGKSTPIASAIREYGPENFVVDVLESGVAVRELGARERYWIDKVGALAPSGFNVLRGGGMGSPAGCEVTYRGEKFQSQTCAARVLGERMGLQPHVVLTRLAAGKEVPESARRHSKHPEAGTRLWRRWKSMINGVEAGRRKGPISIEWMDYDRFAGDVRGKGKSGEVLVRLDSGKAWGGNNFKWVPKCRLVEQVHGVKLVAKGGEFPSWVAAARAHGLSVSTLKHRVRVQGMSLDAALEIPLGKK